MSHSDNQRRTDQHIEQEIESRWKQLIRKKPSVHNGTCYRLASYEAEDVLSLELSRISYRESQCLPVAHIVRHYSPEYYSCSLACSVFLETSDGYIVFGKKGESHRIIGGAYSPDEIVIETGEDIFSVPKSEIQEELGVRHEYIEQLELVGAVSTSHLNCALVFKASVPLSKIEVEHFFHREHDEEHNALVFIKKEFLQHYMKEFHPRKEALFACFLE